MHLYGGTSSQVSVKLKENEEVMKLICKGST